MSYIDSCKGCSASVNVTSDTNLKFPLLIILRIIAFISSDETYSKRIQKCANCKYIEYNTTCRQCGCIVQIRALQQEKDCPYPKNSMWE